MTPAAHPSGTRALYSARFTRSVRRPQTPRPALVIRVTTSHRKQVLDLLGAALVRLDRLTEALAVYSQLLHVQAASGANTDAARITYTQLLKALASRTFNDRALGQSLQWIDEAIRVSPPDLLPLLLLDRSSILVGDALACVRIDRLLQLVQGRPSESLQSARSAARHAQQLGVQPSAEIMNRICSFALESWHAVLGVADAATSAEYCASAVRHYPAVKTARMQACLAHQSARS